jgi:predicted lipoprotein with Yx(FWY)xxD motif
MRRKRTLLMVPVVSVALVAVAIAGCGGNSNDNVKASAPAASAKVSTPSGGKATAGVRTGSLGKYLVDSQGRTLYLFEKDTGTISTCSGACASAWPPSTKSGHPKAGSGVNAALLGNSTRSDGSTQLTYDGHPLYRYAGDGSPGDTNGQGLTQFGGGWYVVSPAGHKIENGETTTNSSGGGNGY